METTKQILEKNRNSLIEKGARSALWHDESARGRGTSEDNGDDRAERLKGAFKDWLEKNRDSLPEKGARAALRHNRFSDTYEDDVEDCRQELFVRLWCPDVLEKLVEGYEQPDGPPDPQCMERYAVAAARNMVRSYLRTTRYRHSKRCASPIQDVIQQLLEKAQGRDDPVRDLLQQEEEAVLANFAVRVHLALKKLPAHLRIAFELVELEGMKKGKAAAYLQKDRKTLRAWLRKAQDELRRMLSSDALHQSQILSRPE